MHIWTKDQYAEFTIIRSKPELKRMIFLRLTNIEKDKKEEEDFGAKKLGLNSEDFF